MKNEGIKMTFFGSFSKILSRCQCQGIRHEPGLDKADYRKILNHASLGRTGPKPCNRREVFRTGSGRPGRGAAGSAPVQQGQRATVSRTKARPFSTTWSVGRAAT